MDRHEEFLKEEYQCLRGEIRLRQNQVINIEKGLVVLLAALYAIVLFKQKDNDLRYPWVIYALIALGPISVFLAGLKVVQNHLRILEIHEYIKSIERHFVRDMKAECGGFERFLRGDDNLLEDAWVKPLRKMRIADRTEQIVILLLFIVTFIVGAAVFLHVPVPEQVL
jgi:hypothetical protein